MPPVSERQRRAMYAAKAGHSTLGIPKKVGEEFTSADKGGKLPERKTHMDKKAGEHKNPRMIHETPGQKQYNPSFGRVLRGALPPRHPGKLNT